uniref:Cytochrome c oxidase subunit 2 n=1 Tax=Placopecten magellanicus TaxID=6577 RepID=Q4FE08_PLAMG|nr:cytochrome c oxidase subunit II [Placopecten magellanicus]AAZ06457.1 cytochrome oxidase subunit II [Placopecten magellanicus]
MMDWKATSLPEPASEQAYNLLVVYEVCLLLGFFIVVVVLWFLRLAVFNQISCSTYLEAPRLEFLWSIVPFFLLVGMCSVSVVALYVNDETNESPVADVMVVGHQWYWSYSMMGGPGFDLPLEWDSRAEGRSSSSGVDFFDLMKVDWVLSVPVKKLVRVLVTSDDVLHSWGCPRLFMKVDAIPGRLTRGLFKVMQPGVFHGMCVELCGLLHSLMPTVVESVPFLYWRNW